MAYKPKMQKNDPAADLLLSFAAACLLMIAVVVLLWVALS